MSAEFLVNTCFVISGLGIIVSGEVRSGEIAEGVVGRTTNNKRCTVVKIEQDGDRIPLAHAKSKVTLTLKHIGKNDVRSWDTVYFD